MKYELETIPIWDTYELDTECPLCTLEERAEERYTEFFLGNSVMVPEMRVEVNKTGFCPQHNRRLFVSEKNRHGLGLVSHTHLKELLAKTAKKEKALGENPSRKQVNAYLDQLKEWERKCMICDRLDYTMRRYAFTIVYLWKKKDDFSKKFGESRGFCLHHLPVVFEIADDLLKGRKYEAFVAQTVALQRQSLERLEGELLWYTQKFDYQNDAKPWGTSKDALQRVLQKLSGLVMHDRSERK
jgi:hypothetical protein